MWFWFALIALLCWSGSDLFSKIGCQDSSDKYSHLKMVMAVGIVMGLHAAYEIFIGKVGITWEIILMYLPVSMLYILSMAIGYLGLRYIELSISSPICNSSGAIVAVLTLITVGIGDDLPPLARQDESNRHYAKSWLAIALPVIYCLLDALGTFADSRVLEKLGEELADACNVAYELTFLVMGIACAIYVLGIKKQRLIPKQEGPKYLGAVCETIGQFFYIYALADTEHVAFAAPIISSYCVASVIWGRIFLKEKLSKKHYACIALVVAGIIIMGILDI